MYHIGDTCDYFRLGHFWRHICLALYIHTAAMNRLALHGYVTGSTPCIRDNFSSCVAEAITQGG